MRLNAAVYRYLRAPKNGETRVHLGPGLKNYLDGWINIDANIVTAKIDVWADLTSPLPFHNGTVDAFYSHHVVEHLPDGSIAALFDEMYRCLKPGGIIRIGGPDGDNAVRKFIEGDTSWFDDWPDKRASIGGRFANFIFCRGEHATILTRSYLDEVAANASFARISFCRPVTETNYPHVINGEVLAREYESTPDMPHTLILEAQKPDDSGQT
jgi:predicted SAM-dependent methyltransferase